MDALAEVRSGLPEGGSIDVLAVPGGVRIRAVFTRRHRLDGALEYQTVGADPYRVYAAGEDEQLASALRNARRGIDAKARLYGITR
jgi:hypothetical protein